jgi:hypothetical protein
MAWQGLTCHAMMFCAASLTKARASWPCPKQGQASKALPFFGGGARLGLC